MRVDGWEEAGGGRLGADPDQLLDRLAGCVVELDRPRVAEDDGRCAGCDEEIAAGELVFPVDPGPEVTFLCKECRDVILDHDMEGAL